MTPERWRQVTEVFHAALARDTAARQAFLDQACASDAALRDEVDAMLAAHATRANLATRQSRAWRATRCVSHPAQPWARIASMRLIGEGGMGQVYRAHDSRIGRDVAIKVLPADYAADAERLRRFEQEARASGALNHPNILTLYDVGTAAGQPYLVMELLDGETLRDRISRGVADAHTRLRDRGRRRARPGGGARERDRPSRSQAGKHHDHPRRAGEGARLRHRQAASAPRLLPTGARRRRRCTPRR